MLKIFNATQTLKDFNQELSYTKDKSEADLMIVGGKVIDLDEFPNLKGIFKTGVGTDNLPFKEAQKRGIIIQLPSDETKEIIHNETASYTLHLILKFVYGNTGIFSTWQKNNRKSLRDYKVLIMGIGNIGRKLVNILSPICEVLTYDPLENNKEELDQLLQKADIVSLHMPLLPTTKHFFNQVKLSHLKDGALLVNTARGPIIDEDALYDELKSRRINAAIDVFSKEPYDGKLTKINPKNIYLSPHVASTCKAFLAGLAKDFLKFHSYLNK